MAEPPSVDASSVARAGGGGGDGGAGAELCPTAQEVHRKLPRAVVLSCVDRAAVPGKQTSDLALLFIHGHGSAKDTWFTTLDAPELEGFRRVAVDIRGHGESPIGKGGDWSGTQLAADILKLVSDKGLKSLLVVGHSMGGRIAVQLCSACPELVRGLIVVDITMQSRKPICKPMTDKELTDASAFSREYPSMDAARAALARWYPEGRVEVAISTGRVFEKESETGEKVVWCGMHPLVFNETGGADGPLNEDVMGAWAFLADTTTFPVTLLRAAKKSAAPEKNAQHMADTMPRLVSHVVPDSEHSIQKTNLPELLRHIQEMASALVAP